MDKQKLTIQLRNNNTRQHEPTEIDGYIIAPGLGIHKTPKQYSWPTEFHKTRWTIVHIKSGWRLGSRDVLYRKNAIAIIEELVKLGNWDQETNKIYEFVDSTKVREIYEMILGKE